MRWLGWLSAAAIGIAAWGPADAQVIAPSSAWRVEDKIDKLDGDRTVTFFVASSDTLEIGGRKTSAAVLAIRCRNRKTDITIHWPVYLGSTGWANVRWRIDDGEIVSETWPADQRARNLITNSQGLKYVRQWFGKKTLVFSINNNPREPQTLTFPIAGLEVGRPMMDALCDW